MGYGARHFEGSIRQGRTGLWAHVLLMCGEFEKVRRCTGIISACLFE